MSETDILETVEQEENTAEEPAPEETEQEQAPEEAASIQAPEEKVPEKKFITIN